LIQSHTISKLLQVSYVLYAQSDLKVTSDVIVRRTTKDELETFAIMKQTIIFFLSFVSSKCLKNSSNNNV